MRLCLVALPALLLTQSSPSRGSTPMPADEFAHFQPARGVGPSGAANGWGCDNGVELDVVDQTPRRATRRWATHGADVRYVFGSEHAPDGLGPPNNWTRCDFTPEEATLSATVIAYWASFAAHADPNEGCRVGGPLPGGRSSAASGAPCAHWPRSSGGASGATQMLVVPDEDGALGPVKAPHAKNCAFWESLPSLSAAS